jgi:hypothetical protein
MFDVRQDLRERFDYAAYFYLSAWERDPDTRIEGNEIVRDERREEFEDQMTDTFEALRDTVDAVPADMLKGIEDWRSRVGAKQYEEIVGNSLIDMKPLPRNATEFVQVLNSALALTQRS